MRLWSLHPKYLDVKGLTALWRESLLAQQVLAGQTKGYRHHPQLIRFQRHAHPDTAIRYYLTEIWHEAERRGYHFNRDKILPYTTQPATIALNQGQLYYERDYLCEKLRYRDAAKYQALVIVQQPDPHPLFIISEGPPAAWEKVRAA